MGTPVRASKRIPLPLSVELYNNVHIDSSNYSSKKKFTTMDTNILRTVTLKIIVNHHHHEEIQVLPHNRPTCHPVWNHLNEILQDITLDEYENMIFRFYHDQVPFRQLPVHPTKLTRILQIPSKLPYNTPIILYTDQTLRIPTEVFKLLEENDLIPEKPQTHDFDFRFRDDAFQTLDSVTPVKAKIISLLDQEETPVQPTSSETISESVYQKDLQEEQEQLRNLLQQERQALEEESTRFQKDKERLESIISNTQDVRDKTELIQQAIHEEEVEIAKETAFAQVRRLQLLQELQSIYPIRVEETGYLTIRGLAISSDVHNAPSEEELSAAIGYVVHVIIMISKYLSISLRYQLIYRSSRSLLIDEQGNRMQLNPGRGAFDRDQLDKAFKCLQINVDCICRAVGIEEMKDVHILDKIKRIYQAVIEG